MRVPITALIFPRRFSSTAPFSSERGLTVTENALLLRGNMSPEGAGFAMQYQVPRVYEDGKPAPVFKKGKPAELALSFVALEDEDASAGEEFGTLVVQTADATS